MAGSGTGHFLFVDIHVLPARAQELPETTTETTQELDGQATTIEATQEQSGQVATTETTQESYNSQTITESGQQTNVIYDSIFDELNLDEVERSLQQQGIQTAMPITEMVKNRWRVTISRCYRHCLRQSAAFFRRAVAEQRAALRVGRYRPDRKHLCESVELLCGRVYQ